MIEIDGLQMLFKVPPAQISGVIKDKPNLSAYLMVHMRRFALV
jgi:hypothetical protein